MKKICLCRPAKGARRGEVVWGHRYLTTARQGFLSIPSYFSARLPAGPRALCIAAPTDAGIRSEPSLFRTRDGTWRGCDAHCGSRYGQGRFSTIVTPLSRCSARRCISIVAHVRDMPGGWALTWPSKYTAVEQARKASS
jgi:hypothetical protein